MWPSLYIPAFSIPKHAPERNARRKRGRAREERETKPTAETLVVQDRAISLSHLRLGVLWIRNLCSVVPILWFRGLGVQDVLGQQNIPVVLDGTSLRSLVVYLDLVGVVWSEDEGVEMGELVILGGRERRGEEEGGKEKEGGQVVKGEQFDSV